MYNNVINVTEIHNMRENRIRNYKVTGVFCISFIHGRTLPKWRLEYNSLPSYILSLVLMFPEKGFFT